MYKIFTIVFARHMPTWYVSDRGVWPESSSRRELVYGLTASVFFSPSSTLHCAVLQMSFVQLKVCVTDMSSLCIHSCSDETDNTPISPPNTIPDPGEIRARLSCASDLKIGTVSSVCVQISYDKRNGKDIKRTNYIGFNPNLDDSISSHG